LKKPGRKPQLRKPKSGKRNPRAKESGADDDFELTKAQLRELDRRIADAKDPVRYLIEGGFGPKFRLYYNVTDDVYVMNDPAHGTLFKRRKAAVAVQKTRWREVYCSLHYSTSQRPTDSSSSITDAHHTGRAQQVAIIVGLLGARSCRA
jgi:hypothetical protein